MTTNNYLTHIIVTGNDDTSTLVRRVDGLLLAYRKGSKLMIGADPRQLVGRDFLNDDFAIKAMRRIAADDQAQRKGKCCRDCGMMPVDAVVCDENTDGVHRIDYDGTARIDIQRESRIARIN